MNKTLSTTASLLFSFVLLLLFSSCANTKKVAYFNDVKDSALIISKAGLEPVIQKKDLLSISISSLSMEATVLFNTPNLPQTPNAASNNTSQTYGYLVSEEGNIKFPVLGDIPAVRINPKAAGGYYYENADGKKITV